jgi:hypothetical protein
MPVIIGSSQCKVSSVTAEDLAQLSPYLTSDHPGAMPAGLIANTVAAMLWAWSTCPECRDRRWTG